MGEKILGDNEVEKSLERLPASRVVLYFRRHGKKEKIKPEQVDADVSLTREGRQQAVALGKELDLHPKVALAIGSPRKRAREVAALAMLAKEPEINPDMTLEQIEAVVAEQVKHGKKIISDSRLDFNYEGNEDYDALADKTYGENRITDFIIHESDQIVINAKDLKSTCYTRLAAQVAELVKKYATISNHFNKIVAEEPDKYQKFNNQMERLLGTHVTVGESFIAKLIEKQQGVKAREEFLQDLGAQGFKEAEGFDVEIVNRGSEQSIILNVKTKAKDWRVEIRPEILEEMIEDGEKFDERLIIAKLEGAGVKNVASAFRVEGEKSLDGEEIKSEIFWLKFRKPEDREFSDLADVEGKIYLPANPNGELILFTPGFPGGNAGRFEQRYAKDFTDAGYSFFTVRHNGTSLTNGAASLEILNSARRMEIAEQKDEHHIGGTKPEGYSPFDIINESITPLLALQGKFKKIHLMGQSMGVAASYNAIRRTETQSEIQDKIGNVVGISGYVGKEHEGATWQGMNMPMDDLTAYEYGYVKKVDANIVPEAQFKAEMAKVAEANKALAMPPQIGNVLVYTPEDLLIAGPDKTQPDYVLNYGPVSKRKLIIRDEFNLGGKKPHSMLWIAPENLLRAVKAKVSSHGPHFFKVLETGADKQGKLIERG